MATYLLDIANYLEAQGQGYTTGRNKDIFIFSMPEQVEKALLLKDHPLGTDYDHELPGYFDTEFQVIVRAKEHAEGEEKAEAVSAALTTLNQTIGELNVNYIRPRHLPMVFPVSEGDYLEWLLTFDANFCN
jgi:hypothetical protein